MKNKKNWSGFSLNLLGVILGIIITFGGNALWQKHEENKKTKEIMILVRNELETNKEWFKYQEKVLNKDRSVCKKILEADKKWENIPKDTLNAYIFQICYLSMTTLSTSAWQIFQNSEMIQKLPNKELVIRLTDTYFAINTSYDFIMKFYWDAKIKTFPPEVDTYEFLNALINNKESFQIITALSKDSFFQDFFINVEAIIDYALLLLDEYGDFRYNMEENDKRYEDFVKARIDSASHKI